MIGGRRNAVSRNLWPAFLTSDLNKTIAILDIHGKMDTFVNYYEEWDWKEGEFLNVGTMKDVPSNVAYWAEKENCMDSEATQTPQYEHIINRDEFGFAFWVYTWFIPCLSSIECQNRVNFGEIEQELC